MPYLLHIDSSSLGEASVSREIAQTFRQAWPGEVVHRDLAAAIGAASPSRHDR